MNYAGFGQRFLAALLDGLIIFAVSVLLNMVLSAVRLGMLGVIAQLAVSIAYYVFYQKKQGQTLGKKVMNIKVVDASGKTPTEVTFFLREIIGKFVSAIILMIGYLFPLWDAKRQALHDKIVNTYVVKA